MCRSSVGVSASADEHSLLLWAQLLLVFAVEALRPSAAKLSARLSVLMPLQALILLGLSPLPAPPSNSSEATQIVNPCSDSEPMLSSPEHAEPSGQEVASPRATQDPFALGGAKEGSGMRTSHVAASARRLALPRSDPVSELFGLASESIGDVSYCQYVLQFIAYSVWPVHDLTDAGRLICFLLFLLSSSALLSHTFLPWSRDLWYALAPSFSIQLIDCYWALVMLEPARPDRCIWQAQARQVPCSLGISRPPHALPRHLWHRI